ncbi:MAG: 50S ribosomal protein L18 [Fervidicoccaceae archaeon]
MAKGPKYKVPRRRRREGKTNYRKRYIIILSGKPRLVIRRSNKYIEAKIVKSKPQGDEVLVAAHSIELVKKFGWKGSTSSTPAAYLVGYLVGLRALRCGVKEAVPDIGLHRPVPGARVFAVIKGSRDAGLSVPASEQVLPSPERIRGEHVAAYAELLERENPEALKVRFSLLLARGFHPKDYPKHFDETLRRIAEEEGAAAAKAQAASAEAAR